MASPAKRTSPYPTSSTSKDEPKWLTVFEHALDNKEEEDITYKIEIKQLVGSKAVSINIAKVKGGEPMGSGIFIRVRELITMANMMFELPVLSDPKVLKESEDEKNTGRRIDIRVINVYPKNMKMILITMVTVGKESETLDIPLSMAEEYSRMLIALSSIVRAHNSSDELKISDVLTYFAVKFRSTYGGKKDIKDFIATFSEVYKKFAKKLGFKIHDLEGELKSVPFKEKTLTLNNLEIVTGQCLDWLMDSYFPDIA